MLRKASDLRGYAIAATDGDIGAVDDFFFDDRTWTIRYLVVDTGGWLSGRRVLLSPISVIEPAWDSRHFRVGLTRAQVEGSPDVDVDMPVSRQREVELAHYYGYPSYWAGPDRWGALMYPAPLAVPPPASSAVDREIESRLREDGDPHLHAVRAVTGYYLEATDGDIGHVADFLVDDWAWAIRYMIVDTRNWWPGKHVLVSPEWSHSVSWADSKVFMDLTREEVRRAPEYDTTGALDRDYEFRLHEHYRRPRYWETEAGTRAA